ncbi:probable RNA 3'-terminal phosphate cyclase-like protein [Lycium ferocissimum]|uniref:probable RNA 3'-terminal phosphate cyclase-like protein n=1 Tax=Lycium ferocissimum TaxID=112874 RepID=UPI002814AED0|nr:probable RNA 3'-terminal phosphate cyclase-like protein [Lycium ferocissimum]
MGKVSYMKLKGSQNLRLRLLLATLSLKSIIIEDIRADSTWPGLRPHEVSFLRLREKVSDDCLVEINETGTKLKYKPGIIMGGRHLVHDCGVSRSITYFLEPLIVLGLFGKKPLAIRLKGITNDSKDPSIDTFRSTTLPIMKQFGVPPEGLELKIESRGVPPKGGGEVVLSVPVVPNSLKATKWVDEGLLKRIRGVSFSTRVSVQFENTVIHAAHGILNPLLSHVHIFTDHKAGMYDESPGYGISLVAETTSSCVISADTAVSYAKGEDDADLEDDRKDLIPAEEVGEQIASALLAEIKQGGVVDSTHQGLLFLLCALCPKDVLEVRVGKLSPYGIEALRHIRDFLGVKFFMKPDASTGTVNLMCLGSGFQILSRKVS